jgi:hypothetical protein
MMLRCHRCRVVTHVVVRDGSGKSAPQLCRRCYDGKPAREQRQDERQERLRQSVPEAFR